MMPPGEVVPGEGAFTGVVLVGLVAGVVDFTAELLAGVAVG